MKGRLLHENRPLSVYELTPDEWEIWIRTSPPARLFCTLACPASVLGVAYLATLRSLSADQAVIGVMLIVTFFLCLFALSRSVRVRLTRDGAERRYRVFGLHWTTRLSYSRDAPPRMGVQRTHVPNRSARGDPFTYQAVLESRGQEIPVGPDRNRERDAKDDCDWLRRFFGVSEFGLPVTKERPRLGDWAGPLAPGGADRVCPLCRESLSTEPALVECQGCGTAYHQECATEFGHCSTLGCKHLGRHKA